MNVYPNYAEYFSAKARFTPHDWQATLAVADHPCNRLIRIPTGFGKTAGTVLAWLWHRGMPRRAPAGSWNS